MRSPVQHDRPVAVVDAPAPVELSPVERWEPVAPERRARAAGPVARRGVLAAIGALLAASPFVYGYYDSSVWAPAGLVLAAAVAALAVAGVVRPSRLAVVAVAALALLAGWALLSSTWAASTENAFVDGNRLVVYALAFALLAVLVRTRVDTAWLLGGLLAGAAVVGAVVVGRMAAGDTTLFLRGRLNLPLGYVNGQGDFFLLMLWPCLALAESKRGPPLAGLGLAGATLCAALLALSESRGVAIALAVATLAVLAIAPGRLRRASALLLVVACVGPALPLLVRVSTTGEAHALPPAVVERAAGATLIAALVAGVVWAVVTALVRDAGPDARRRLRRLAAAGMGALVLVAGLAGVVEHQRVSARVSAEYHSFVTLGKSGGDASDLRLFSGAGNRYDYWRVAIDEWKAHPLAGIGAGNFMAPYVLHRRTTEDVRQPHSLLVQTLSELGLVGMALLLVMLGAIALGARRLARAARRDPRERLALVAGLGLFAAWLAHTSVDWMHLLPGLTGMALCGAAILVRPGGRRRPGRDPARCVPRPRVRRVGVAAATLAGVMWLGATTLSVSRQFLAERYRSAAQAALAADPARAVVDANSSLRLDPDAVDTYYVKAAGIARFGDGAGATRVLESAAGREPGNYVTWVLLGDLAVRRGRLADARRYYGRASALNPRDASLRRLATDPAAAPSQTGAAT